MAAKKLTTELTKSRETKNTVVFQESEGTPEITKSVYVNKGALAALGDVLPQKIKVTIEVLE